MATLIKVDGTTEEVTPANGESFTLKELQTLVGGYIQMVDLAWLKKHGRLDPEIDASYMIVDEEGKLKNLLVNEVATKLIAGRDIIVGRALLCDDKEFV